MTEIKDKVCKHCGSKYDSDNIKYCSLKCKNNSQWKNLPKFICKHCGKEFTTKFRLYKGYTRIYCSVECRMAHQVGRTCYNWQPRLERICLICGKHFTVKPYAVRHGIGLFCSQSCKGTFTVKNMKKKGTDIELKTEKWLISNNVPFIKQKVIRAITVTTIVDFFVEPNHCIYVDGSYWHSLPKTVIRDKKQTIELSKMGYNVVRLKQVNNDLDCSQLGKVLLND